MRAVRAAFLLALLAFTPGCIFSKNYIHNRAADLVDVLRVHLIVGNAIGAEVQVTQWVGLGFMYENNAWAGGLYNRAVGTWTESIQAWGLLIHNWKETVHGIPIYSGSYGWYQRSGQSASFSHKGSTLDLFTIRASAAVIVGADVELRLGQVFDFVAGIFTWDPAHDDT